MTESGVNGTWLPGVNIVLGLVCITWLTLRTSHRWGEYPKEIRLALLALLMVLFALIITSVEQFINRDETPLRSALVITFVKCFTMLFLYLSRHTLFRTTRRKPGSGVNDEPGTGDTDQPDRDIKA